MPIKSLWRAADQIGGTEGKYLKLMILLGKRKTALAEMCWEKIEDDWFWDAPPSKVKNKRLHGVPLPILAQRILHPRQAQGEVFGEIDLDRLQEQVKQTSGIGDFFWHGLRHLAETKTAELQDNEGRSLILPHIRDLLFDHVPQRGSGKSYDHHDYKAEMKAAMEAWSDYVTGLVQPDKRVRVAALRPMLILLALTLPASAQPTPLVKVGACPSGYRTSGAYCAPLDDRAPDAIVKTGSCPSSWMQSGAYCIRIRAR